MCGRHKQNIVERHFSMNRNTISDSNKCDSGNRTMEMNRMEVLNWQVFKTGDIR